MARQGWAEKLLKRVFLACLERIATPSALQNYWKHLEWGQTGQQNFFQNLTLNHLRCSTTRGGDYNRS